MLLEKIFAPKWKHKNAQVRKRALLGMDPKLPQTQRILLEVVQNDPELFIRRLAIHRLTDIDAVQALRHDKQNQEIYQEANNRLCELLSSVSTQRTFGDIKKRLEALGEARILEYVAKHAGDEALQKFALQKIDNEMVLTDVLLDTAYPDIRKLILDKLHNVNALKRIIKSLKRKDKQLAAQAQEKLDQLNAARERGKVIQQEYRRVGQDFLDLFNLCKLSQAWGKYALRLHGLHEQWRGLSVNMQETSRSQLQWLAQQVESAYTEFEEALKNAPTSSDWEVTAQGTHSDAIDTLQTLSDQVNDHLRTLKPSLHNVADQLEQLQGFIDSLKQQWQSTYDTLLEQAGIALPSEDLPHIKSAFESGVAQLEDILRQLPQWETRQRQLQRLTENGQALLAGETFVTARQVDELERRYRNLGKAVLVGICADQDASFHEVLKALRDKLMIQQQRRQDMVEEFAALCEELQEAVTQGRSKHSTHLLNRGRKLLKSLDAAGRELLEKHGAAASFQALSRQCEELRDWRNWSSASVKEQLITDMRQLAGHTSANADNPDFDFAAAAAAVKEARDEWKKLTRGEQAPDQAALWQSFDDACNQAYGPCQLFFEQQGEQRSANLRQREQVCQDLETYLTTVQHKVTQNSQGDSAEVDWQALEKILRTARQDWGKLGIVNRGDRTIINKRFNQALHALDKLLRVHKQDNQDAKQALIKRVETLAAQLKDQALTLEQAIAGVKEAQATWKTIGPGSKEKSQWSQFRAACDSVFAVRDAEQAALQQQVQQEKQRRIELIEQVESAARMDDEGLRASRAQIEHINSDWRELPKLKNTHPLERRYREACKRFELQLAQLQDARLREDKQSLQSNVSLCYQLEQAIFNCLSGDLHPQQLEHSVAEAERQWQVPNSAKLKSIAAAIRDRFDGLKETAAKITTEGVEDLRQILQAEENTVQDHKDKLCIEMEVLANADSPPASRQRRMEYQVAVLAQRMKQPGSGDSRGELENLLVQWHRSGLLDPHVAQGLERRFYSALQSLDKDYQYSG